MPGSLQPRVKTWVSTEDVTHTDLNAEFDNVLTAMQPLLIDDYSTNVAQMQVTADPGEVGTESLATTLAGEIARLRSQLKEITGEDQWYESPVASLLGLANSIGTSGLTANRLVSGRERTGSDQPLFLVPHGAARTVTVDGTPTNFKYYVEGIEYTISTDVTLTNLTLAPSSNNTCLINDTNASDQYWTKYAGEDGSEIPIDTAGSEITALIGKFAAFSLNNGSTTEMFFAKVKSATALTEARRGYFFDSTDTPQARIVYSNNDTITLLKLSWIFAKTDGTLTVTYNNPIWSLDEPSSPSANDFWFDYATNKWKKYDVSNFIDADATLIGVCAQDTSNCVAARSFEFFQAYSELNTIEIIFEGNNSVRSRWPGSTTSVWGVNFKNDQGVFTWDTSTDLDTGTTDAASTMLYFYIKETGDEVISLTKPYDRREDLLGYYHPHHSWRCFGFAFNDGSANLTAVESFYTRYPKNRILHSQTAAANIQVVNQVTPLNSTGGAFTHYLPPAAYMRGQTLTFIKTDSSANAITIDGFGSETINGATTLLISVQYAAVTLLSDGTSWIITSRKGQNDRSEVWVYTGNAYGSTNTKIRRWVTEGRNVGTAITYADSAANGGSFTINENGLYAVAYTESLAAAAYYGVSVNSSELTTNIQSITAADRRIMSIGASAGEGQTGSMTLFLASGDVVRGHTDGAAQSVDTTAQHFRITKVD